MKNLLLKNQPREVVGFLPPVQPSLEMTPQLATTRALKARTAQPSLGMAPRTTHIHPTRLTRVKGWVESQVLWCNVHNVRVRVRMAKLTSVVGSC